MSFSAAKRKKRWDAEAPLQKGMNKLVLRVYDAFQDKNFIDVDAMQINIKSDKVDEK